MAKKSARTCSFSQSFSACQTHLGVDANPEVVTSCALEVEPDGLRLGAQLGGRPGLGDSLRDDVLEALHVHDGDADVDVLLRGVPLQVDVHVVLVGGGLLVEDCNAALFLRKGICGWLYWHKTCVFRFLLGSIQCLSSACGRSLVCFCFLFSLHA